MSISMAYSFGLNYIIFSTFAELWTQRYGQSVSRSDLDYIALAIGNTITAQGGARCTDRVWANLKNQAGGDTALEYRVPMIIPVSVLIPIELFWYGWAGVKRAYWVITDIGAGIFAAGIILATQAMQAFVLDSLPEYTTSATTAKPVPAQHLPYLCVEHVCGAGLRMRQ